MVTHDIELELAALAATNEGGRPPGWRLSPRKVSEFIVGSNGQTYPVPKEARAKGDPTKITIQRKFYGDDPLIDRCVVTLASERGLMLVGEPGTAKSMLSELLALAISGTALLTIQGSAAVTEDQIRYAWNYALLLARGPSEESLVPAPLLLGMRQGQVVRFEEITRCPPEVQDTLVSVLSERLLLIPELGATGVVYAAPSFNVIGTANLRDRGVHEMSAALKRRFNFETVYPIAELSLEKELVRQRTTELLGPATAAVDFPEEVLHLLVSTFQELRWGKTAEGWTVDRPGSVLSTAEAVAISHTAALHALYYRDGTVIPEDVARHLVGAVAKEDPADLTKLRAYWESVVRQRADNEGGAWKDYYAARHALGR